MKNLVVGVVGDASLHRTWTNKPNPNFDLFLAYYGEKDGQYARDAKYYDRAKGTKFIIMDQLLSKHEDVISQYDAVFVPDDDIHMEASEIEEFFETFHQYGLWVAQPSIIGWYSVPTVLNNPNYTLRYTNWVEIMLPCFSKKSLEICRSTFTENRTNWGIEFLWDQLLGSPKDKIAIIDKIAAVHTRPCFFGDTYMLNNNNQQIAMKELEQLGQKHGVELQQIIYGGVPIDLKACYDLPSEDRFYPPCLAMKKKVSDLHTKKKLIL
jgi:hypothetical protein